jgi:hypothetical protein
VASHALVEYWLKVRVIESSHRRPILSPEYLVAILLNPDAYELRFLVEEDHHILIRNFSLGQGHQTDLLRLAPLPDPSARPLVAMLVFVFTVLFVVNT